MSASLVGSEMCIRDRHLPDPFRDTRAASFRRLSSWRPSRRFARTAVRRTVSYTHLTLPTICSV
eukprot:7285230-Alexandrium_andersonii.AAC.1